MSSKISNKTLTIVFGILLIIALFTFVFDGGKNERTFRDELVSIDTSRVDEILIYPKSKNHQEVKIYKEDVDWRVVLSDERTAPVTDEKIKSLFNQLLTIKPKRLAARGAEKWAEFQVDTTGTRIKVSENGEQTLDIILGRFSFQQPRSMSTYVRLGNDNDVYEVDGFLEMSFNQDANAFRNNGVLKSDFNSWEKLSFDYPADSSFILTKLNEKWFANDLAVDSAETVRYLRTLSNLSGSGFVDDIDPSNLINPDYRLTIFSETDTLSLAAYLEGERYIVATSYNPETYFDGSTNALGEKIFIGLSKLRGK
jgi:hypothetical protein